jgi:hypothetical protein
MNISRDDLHRAAGEAGLTTTQADAVWRSLEAQAARSTRPRFDVAHVAYYLGALIVMGAMGWFMNKAWNALGGPGLTAIATCYAGCFVLAGRTLWAQPHQRIPGGLLFTIAVGMVPLAVFGLERWAGFWPADDPGSYTNFHPYIHGSWIIMEIATVLAGLLAIRRWPFPFLTAPIAYALWYLAMDLPALLLRREPFSWEEKQFATTGFGAVMLGVAYVTDLQGTREDYAFWGYLFGLAAFWGGLSSMDSHSELGKLLYCLINLGLIGASLVLRRRVFLVFGAMGLFGYLGHLAFKVFADSIFFPFALTLLGISVIYFGVQYQRRRAAIEQRIRARIVPHLRSFLPPRSLVD